MLLPCALQCKLKKNTFLRSVDLFCSDSYIVIFFFSVPNPMDVCLIIIFMNFPVESI